MTVMFLRLARAEFSVPTPLVINVALLILRRCVSNGTLSPCLYKYIDIDIDIYTYMYLYICIYIYIFSDHTQ